VAAVTSDAIPVELDVKIAEFVFIELVNKGAVTNDVFCKNICPSTCLLFPVI